MGWLAQMATIIVFEIVFGLIGSTITCAFSRWREYRADAGGALYAGRTNMISALERLKSTTELVDTNHKAMATLKISGAQKGLVALFLTHPPLEKRIARLKQIA